jgi:hypothetical protein
MKANLARLAVAAAILVITGLFPACSGKPDTVKAGESAKTQMTQKTIEQVQAEHTEAWMKIRGVVGIAIGECDGKPCLKILAASLTPEIKAQIPKLVDGYAVVVEVTGEFRAH